MLANSTAVVIQLSDLCICPLLLLLLADDCAYDHGSPERPEVTGHEEYMEVFGVTPRRAHRLSAGRF